MARKVRRVRRQRKNDQQQTGSSSGSGGGRRSSEEELRDEYAYVLSDLRHVLVLAAFMFLLLIVLNLVL